MAFVPVNMAGSLGFASLRDNKPHLLPPNAWTLVENMRFEDNVAKRITGHYQVGGALNVAPYELFFLQDTNNDYWVYCGLAKVAVTVAEVSTDLTRTTGGDYSATADLGWSGGVLHGVLVLNNAVDTPQMWSPPGTGTKLTALTAWPASTTARIIRPFRNFLVALDVTKSGTRYPYMVKWSHAADPGTVPDSWDEADATRLTGEVDIGQTADRLVDCLSLGNHNIIYKEASMYLMQFVGFPQVFRFDPIQHSTGIFTKRCVAEFKQGLHCVLGNNDLIVHDGQTITPIGDKSVRRWLYETIDADNFERTFLVNNYRSSEVWICFPEAGASFATLALVWNHKDGTFTTRELPGVASAQPGVIATSSSEAWNGTPDNIWDDLVEPWNAAYHNPTIRDIMLAGTDDTKLYFANRTQRFDGVAFTSKLERVGLAFERIKTDFSYTTNTESWKFIRALRPRITSNTGAVVTVHVATQEHINASIVWHGPYSFTSGTDYKIDLALSARLFGVRFESNGTAEWTLDGYDFDIEPLAMY